ncbi:HNH endonuclease signature motif containing protein [Novosphingobium olei]|uniref:HNH endonuclease signature motif containing protein n=1 Tax=Novosphingobium olei TaxID=2728851 RepID=UPI0030D28A2B
MKLPSMKPGLPTMGAAVPLPVKRADTFYQSNEWRRLVVRRRLDRDYQQARARAKPNERLILDHIVERKDGGADLDPKNTQWLTHSEHQAKTARSKRARSGIS